MAMNLGSFASRVVATKVVALDGTGDFTDIQSAIDDLPAGGGVVYIKEGTYTITSAIRITKDDVALIGAGKSTKIQTTSNVPIIYIGTYPFTRQNGISITGLFLYGAGSGNSLNDGLAIFGNYVFVDHCWIENCGGAGILWAGVCQDSFISYNYVESCQGNGISVESTRGVIIGNICKSNVLNGIIAGVDDGSVIGNQVIENVRHGIWCYDMNNSTCSGNIAKGNDANDTATYDGICVENADNNVISNNRCRDNDRYEINISNAACDNNLIHGNHCIGTDHVGAINDSGTTTTLADNVTA